jgi:hypothetical protein
MMFYHVTQVKVCPPNTTFFSLFSNAACFDRRSSSDALLQKSKKKKDFLEENKNKNKNFVLD